MNSLPDFEPGYIRCTVKPLEHRGPWTPKGQPPSPRSPSIWLPRWLLHTTMCAELWCSSFFGARKAVGTQPVSVCPSLAEDTVQARRALVKEWEQEWERGWPASGTACTPAAFIGLWRQRQRTRTKLTFDAKQLLRLLLTSWAGGRRWGRREKYTASGEELMGWWAEPEWPWHAQTCGQAAFRLRQRTRIWSVTLGLQEENAIWTYSTETSLWAMPPGQKWVIVTKAVSSKVSFRLGASTRGKDGCLIHIQLWIEAVGGEKHP